MVNGGVTGGVILIVNGVHVDVVLVIKVVGPNSYSPLALLQ